MTSGKKIKEVLKDACKRVGAVDAHALLKNVLSCDEIYLALHKDDEIKTESAEKFENFVLQREKSKPVSYITNFKEFMGLSFYVDENVLIPRSETELLVEKIIELNIKKDKILDLCTGSGAIGVSLAKYIENSDVLCADISDGALKIAEKNAKTKNIRFKKCDVLCDIKNIGEKFDVVVSNPPYVKKDVIDTLSNDVKNYEPHLALDGGNDGLLFYRKIISDIGFVLKKGGYLFFEIGFDQGEDLKKLMEDNFSSVTVLKDLSSLDRIVFGKYTGEEK